MSDVESKAEKIIKMCEELGAKEAEALLYALNDRVVRFSKNVIQQHAHYHEEGVYLRLVNKNNRHITVFLQPVSKEQMKTILSKVLEKNADTSRAGHSNIEQPSFRYIDRTDEVEDDEYTEKVYQVVNAGKTVSRKVSDVTGAIFSRVSQIVFHNTAGNFLQHRYTGSSCVCVSIAEDYGSTGVGFSSQNSRSIKEILFDNIAEEASRDAVSSLNPQKLELGSYDTIFQSDAAGDIIGSFIQLGFSVRRWEDYVEVGSVCGPEILTVKDDPLNRETLIPLPFDSEGTPTKPLTLVDRGVVKNKCFDKKLALQKNTVSTGHSPFTHDITYSSKFFVGWPYYPTNQFVSPGSGDSQSLIENERRAVLVKRLMYAGLPMGVHATEQHRDVMEAYTMGTWLVKDGEVEHSLHSLRISESLSKMIKSVKEVGGVNTIKRLGCLNTPWIVVSNVTYTEEADLSFRV